MLQGSAVVPGPASLFCLVFTYRSFYAEPTGHLEGMSTPVSLECWGNKLLRDPDLQVLTVSQIVYQSEPNLTDLSTAISMQKRKDADFEAQHSLCLHYYYT